MISQMKIDNTRDLPQKNTEQNKDSRMQPREVKKDSLVSSAKQCEDGKHLAKIQLPELGKQLVRALIQQRFLAAWYWH
jgi:hypothetical protein